MCGRTACTLAPDEWCAACRREGIHVEWHDVPKQEYCPSYNVPPSSNTPVIVNGQLWSSITKEKISSEYVMQPMMWNLVPHFYKEEYPHDHGYKTNNCRAETVLEKPMFSYLMKKGNRCAVLCDGFYEWQNKDDIKTPYFIYSPQPKTVNVWDRNTWQADAVMKDETQNSSGSADHNPWRGLRPLILAGLFSRYWSPHARDLWSYTVLTTKAGQNFKWLHHRVPVVLPDAAAVQQWLDPSTDPTVALKLVSGEPTLEWHIVSSHVNKSRNNGQQCVAPLKQKKGPQGPSNRIMATWLQMSSVKAEGKEAAEKTGKREADSYLQSEVHKKPKM